MLSLRSVVLLSAFIVLNVALLSVIMQITISKYTLSECSYTGCIIAESIYAECTIAESRYSECC